MPWNQDKPSVTERVVAGLCYLTFGLVGLLYIVISGRRGRSDFFQFNFLQSILLSIFGLLLGWASGIFSQLILGIFGLADGITSGISSQLAMWISAAVVIIVRAAYLLVLYATIWAFLGKYAEIPFVSNIVRQQMR